MIEVKIAEAKSTEEAQKRFEQADGGYLNIVFVALDSSCFVFCDSEETFKLMEILFCSLDNLKLHNENLNLTFDATIEIARETLGIYFQINHLA